jgi:hypothetical protein
MNKLHARTINISREVKTLFWNQKEMLEIKNTVTEMKNAFDELISRADTAEETISKFDDISVETAKSEKETGKK